MKIVTLDGQGGGIGRAFIEQLKKAAPEVIVYAAGTNEAATQAMVRAGADRSVTGEDAVVSCLRDADIIVGAIA
jgi:prephenate dehydrogenase